MTAAATIESGYKLTEVGVIPEDWGVCQIGEVAEANWGNTNVTKAAYKESGFPAYSAAGFDGFISWFEHDRSAVVVSAIGAQCGKTWLATGRWTAIKNTIWIRGNGDGAMSEFIYIITGDPGFWPNRGQAQPFIALADVRASKIPLPPPAEQRAIAESLGDMAALIAGLDALLAKKRAIK